MTPERITELRALLDRPTFDHYSSGSKSVECEQALPECLDEIERLRKALIKVYDESGNCPLCDCHEHTKDCALR